MSYSQITYEHLENLNDAQKEAVLYENGPLLILAGAGTGKTKVLTSRIVNLIKEGFALPYQILAVTFTNKAAKEMVVRVSDHIPADGLWLSTFHSIAAKILRKHSAIFELSNNFTIIGFDDQIRLVKGILKDQNIDDKKYPAKMILSIIDRWKDLALSPADLSSGDIISSAHNIAKNVYGIYQTKLKFLDAVDFGDLIIYNIRLFSKHPDILEQYHNRFKYILVDEYQDTNVAQYMWLRLLINSDKNICCVGDEDQSIYGWRGAEIGNILRFEKDFPNAKIIRLEQNYRSTNNILISASSLISNNNHRLGKNLWADSGDGDKVQVVTLDDGNGEAKYASMLIKNIEKENPQNIKNIGILVRAGFQTRSFEESFIYYGIPYKIIGGVRFYERQEIRDILAYIRITINPGDRLAFERIINLPKRGIGPSNLSMVTDYAENHQMPILHAVSEMIDGDMFRPKIKAEMVGFIKKIQEWHNNFSKLDVQTVVTQIIEESGYLDMWKMEKTVEAEGRVENIREFLEAIKSFSNVNEFMEHVSLVTDNEVLDNENRVNVMTIHAAKGLEFDVVMLPGWEEGIFPNQKNIDESGTKGLEEERRLAYVAITRAKKQLFITKTISRNIFGKWQNTVPSRFVEELPEKNILKFNHSSSSRTNYSNNNSYVPVAQDNAAYALQSHFKLGGRVVHNKFGAGYVIKIVDNQLEISFDKYGTKKVLDNFVKKI